jgi:hypothetical protein
MLDLTRDMRHERVSAEAACETLHNPLPRKRHERSRQRRDERPVPCLRQNRAFSV